MVVVVVDHDGVEDGVHHAWLDDQDGVGCEGLGGGVRQGRGSPPHSEGGSEDEEQGLGREGSQTARRGKVFLAAESGPPGPGSQRTSVCQGARLRHLVKILYSEFISNLNPQFFV